MAIRPNKLYYLFLNILVTIKLASYYHINIYDQDSFFLPNGILSTKSLY